MDKKSRGNSEEMTRNLRSHNITPQLISSSASIQSLPQEALLNIFSYLSLGEVCNTVPKVCKDWEKVHWNPDLYSLSMTLRGKKKPEHLSICLKDALHLASPYYDSESINNIIEKSLENHKKVQGMEIGKKTFVYKFDKDLIKMLAHLSQVTFTQLPDNAISKAITRLFSFCIQLEELKLYGNFETPVVRNPVLIALCEKLCGTLRVLHVDCVKWNLNAVNAIYKCRLLEDLAIREANDLPTESLLVIARMSTLRRLQIDHCCRPDASDWICMFSNDNLKDLTSLILEYCSHNDDVAVTIGTNLKNLTVLTMISWLGGRASKKPHVAMKGLNAIIKGCNKLTKLELFFGGYKDRQLAHTLLLIPEYLPQLKRLTAFRLRTTLRWRRRLKRKMPDLLIREMLSAEFE